ncbi:uncharacterized protein PG986_003145 [Apiospora aurea]|uniref:Uncharacterized protein n=1 Tax=Apiospora aurea TaxID=335848 RepID=A0ABR1QR14_9PEZI
MYVVLGFYNVSVRFVAATLYLSAFYDVPSAFVLASLGCCTPQPIWFSAVFLSVFWLPAHLKKEHPELCRISSEGADRVKELFFTAVSALASAYHTIHAWWSRLSSPVNPPTDEQAEQAEQAEVPEPAVVQPPAQVERDPRHPKPYYNSRPYPARQDVIEHARRQAAQKRVPTQFEKGLIAHQEAVKKIQARQRQSVNPLAPGYVYPARAPRAPYRAVRDPDMVRRRRQQGIDKLAEPKLEPHLRSDMIKGS